MSTKLSPEAARAKYEYNKKYQQRYWEKKAASKRAAAQQQIQTEPVSVPAMVWTTNGTSRLSKPRTKHSTAKIDGS